ncbi:hypothetical protein, partial [Massilia phosphatilytica]
KCGPAGKYLVRADGTLAYLVDPGINGQYHTRPDGSEVKKFDAPKAVLMSSTSSRVSSTTSCRGPSCCSA